MLLAACCTKGAEKYAPVVKAGGNEIYHTNHVLRTRVASVAHCVHLCHTNHHNHHHHAFSATTHWTTPAGGTMPLGARLLLLLRVLSFWRHLDPLLQCPW